MAGKKRSDFQKTRDRRVLVKLWAADMYTQQQMADLLQEITGSTYKLSQQQISYDLNLIDEKLQELTAKEMGRAKAEMLAELDGLKIEYKRGYKRSIREKVKQDRKIKNDEDGQSKEIKVQTEEVIGDKGWLDSALDVIKQQAKIQGLESKNINFRDLTREKFEGDDPEQYVKKELQKDG